MRVIHLERFLAEEKLELKVEIEYPDEQKNRSDVFRRFNQYFVLNQRFSKNISILKE